MRNRPDVGKYLFGMGMLMLICITIGDAATPSVEHLDVLALAMAVSGAVLARDPRA